MLDTYKVADSDTFRQELYPTVIAEILHLSQALSGLRSAHKSAMIISFLKDHRINSKWLEGNKELIHALTSGAIPSSHLESLFNACKHNKMFLSDLEEYITAKMA